MSRQLWGWIGAVVAGAALMAPAASAHAAPSRPDSPAIGSSNAPGDQSSATPRGYKLTITRAGNNVRDCGSTRRT